VKEGIGVGVPQPRHSYRRRSGRTDLAGRLCENAQRLGRLTKVGPGARLHQDHLYPLGGIKAKPSRLLGQLEGSLRAAESPLTVGHHGHEVVSTRHPTDRTQLTQGGVIVTSGVGRFGGCLADDRQPGGTPACRFSVSVGKLRVVIDELPGGDQVRGDDLGKFFGQPTQFGPHAPVQRP
jgi:hypothetical protein